MGKFTAGWLLGGCALALFFMPLAAIAQQSYVGIEQRLTAEQLREVGLTSAQLELLNRMLRESTERHRAPERSDAEPQQAPRSYVGLDDTPIKSRLIGEVSGWEPGTVFKLENGQQWKVLKGSMNLRKALQRPEIVVVPGVAGRWFLQVNEDLPKARVYRID